MPVTLMSVDVDCSTNRQLDLCRKYRLMDVIRKHHDGTLNHEVLIAAARDDGSVPEGPAAQDGTRAAALMLILVVR
jgi:hypothetical protein